MQGSAQRHIQCFFSIGLLTLGAMLFECTSSLEAADVTLAWDGPTNTLDGTPMTNLTGYRLYYGTASQTYSNTITTGLTPTAIATNLQEGVTYYFAVVACTDAGIEGAFSEELAWTPPPALKMTSFTATSDMSRFGYTVQWASEPGKYYTVLRSTNLMAASSFSALASHVQGLSGITSYTDTNITASGACFYMIKSEL